MSLIDKSVLMEFQHNRAQRCLTSGSRRNHHNTTPHSQLKGRGLGMKSPEAEAVEVPIQAFLASLIYHIGNQSVTLMAY